MKNSFGFIFSICILFCLQGCSKKTTSSPTPTPVPVPVPVAATYQLVWFDEFNKVSQLPEQLGIPPPASDTSTFTPA